MPWLPRGYGKRESKSNMGTEAWTQVVAVAGRCRSPSQHILLLYQKAERAREVCRVERRDLLHCSREQGKIRLPSCDTGTAKPWISLQPQARHETDEAVGLKQQSTGEEVSFLQRRSRENRSKSSGKELLGGEAKSEMGYRCNWVLFIRWEAVPFSRFRSVQRGSGQLYDLESTGARNGDLYAGESLWNDPRRHWTYSAFWSRLAVPTQAVSEDAGIKRHTSEHEPKRELLR